MRSSVSSSNWVWASWATVAQNSTWESYSAVNSTVVTVTPVTIRSYASGGNIVVMGSGGPSDASLQYRVVTATNVATPLAQWTPVLTNNLDGSGNFSNAVPVDLTKPSQYYQVVIP